MRKQSMIFIMAFMVFLVANQALAKNQEIVVSGTEWEPYHRKNLVNQGFLTEITVEAFKSVHYEVRVKLVPWKRAMDGTKKGKYGALMGASYTEERTQFFAYPQYAWESFIHFFAQKGRNITYKTVEDLCPAKLGVLSGSFYINRFSAIDCLKIDKANRVLQNLQKLAKGRIDFIIESKDSILYYLSQSPELADNIELVSPHFEIDKIYTVISKKIPDYEKVTRDFDQGIQLIKENGTYDRILNRHGY